MSDNMDQNQNDETKPRKSPESQTNAGIIMPGAITRERSFIRTTNQQNLNKRRSLAFNMQSGGNQSGQMRAKPAMDIYRPPNLRTDGGNSLSKLNVHAQEFTMISNKPTTPGDLHNPRSSMVYSTPTTAGLISQSKSTANVHQHIQYMPGAAITNRRHAGLSVGSMPTMTNSKVQHGHRQMLVSHNVPVNLNSGGNISQQLPLVNSPSSGNILHQTASSNRVKFAAEPPKHQIQSDHNHLVQTNNSNKTNKGKNIHQQQQQQQMHAMNQYFAANNINNGTNGGGGDFYNLINLNPLQRSKSLSSADALTRGIAGLGLALGNEITDIGQFAPDIKTLVDNALEDPNQLNSRSLMELTSHFIKRAVEGRRYALPISRLCLNIIGKENKETFLEALLNTCRQWYQEREKLLFTIQGMKSPSRARFTAFMAFLTEMFCQLKRRQLQLRTQREGIPPPMVLLTLLSKCCEDCVKPPVRSLSEIECLFFVLTCIGRDMEIQLPQQLEILLSLVRDAFLNASDSAPAIRRTLLQLIELQASHWQLPGNTVLYYYPSSK